ncbi:MAG: LytTR family DNA-binding domain-containing protein [Bacteroidota bacterium]
MPKNLLRYFLLGCLIAFFLIYFQPFGTDRATLPYKKLFLSGYGWITFLAFSFVFIVLPKLFPRPFYEENWVVWKQIMLNMVALGLTFLGCYLYLYAYFEATISWSGFLRFSLGIFPMAVVPAAITVLLDYIYLLKKHQGVANQFNAEIKPATPTATTFNLQDENGKVDFTVRLDQLIFVKAASNYVEINYQEGEDIKRYLLRNSIRNIESQLEHAAINRCHRSYLVNLEKVGRITGNAQGYKLHFPFTAEYVVPVSRAKGKQLLQILREKAS